MYLLEQKVIDPLYEVVNELVLIYFEIKQKFAFTHVGYRVILIVHCVENNQGFILPEQNIITIEIKIGSNSLDQCLAFILVTHFYQWVYQSSFTIKNFSFSHHFLLTN